MSHTSVVIFGATGDLSLRMLYPSLYFLDADGFLAEGLRIVGAARSAMEAEAFVAKVEAAVRERAGGDWSDAVWRRFAGRLGYVAADAGKPESFDALCAQLHGDLDALAVGRSVHHEVRERALQRVGPHRRLQLRIRAEADLGAGAHGMSAFIDAAALLTALDATVTDITS